MKSRLHLLPPIFALGLALTGCASTTADVPRGEMANLNQFNSVMQRSTGRLDAELQIESEQLSIGKTVRVVIGSRTGGRTYLFQLGTSGGPPTLIFPNEMDGANYLAPGDVVRLPRGDWGMRARGPAGVSYLLAVVTENPQDIFRLQAGLARGNLAIEGAYAAALRTIRETDR